MRLFLLILFFSMQVSANDSVFKPVRIVTEANTLALTFNFSKQTMFCGIAIEWGDGTSDVVRLGNEPDKTISIEHSYDGPRTVQFEVRQKLIFDGLKSVPPCIGFAFKSDPIEIGKKTVGSSPGENPRSERLTATYQIPTKAQNADDYEKLDRRGRQVSGRWEAHLYCQNTASNFNRKPQRFVFLHDDQVVHEFSKKIKRDCPRYSSVSQEVGYHLNTLTKAEKDELLKPFSTHLKKYLQSLEDQLDEGSSLDGNTLKAVKVAADEIIDIQRLFSDIALGHVIDTDLKAKAQKAKSNAKKVFFDKSFVARLRQNTSVEQDVLETLKSEFNTSEVKSKCLELVSASNFSNTSKACADFLSTEQHDLIAAALDIGDSLNEDIFLLSQSIRKLGDQRAGISKTSNQEIGKIIASQKSFKITELDRAKLGAPDNLKIFLSRGDPRVKQTVREESVLSKFKSGTVKEPNPAYAQAQNYLVMAQQNYDICYGNFLARKASDPGNPWIWNLCSREDIDKAQALLIRTAPYKDKPVFVDYKYSLEKRDLSKSETFKIYASAGDGYRVGTCDAETQLSFELADGFHPQDMKGQVKFNRPEEVTAFVNAPLAAPYANCIAALLNSDATPISLAAIQESPKKTVSLPADSISEVMRNDKPANRLTAVSEVLNKSVVIIDSGTGIGTGFYITPKYIISNHHVVESAPLLQIKNKSGEIFSGFVMATDPDTDLALVVTNKEGQPAKLLPNIVEQGIDVYALGHPKGLQFSISRGIVSALRTRDSLTGSYGVIQTDAAISPGNSGGPLVLSDGRVVGVNTFKRVDLDSEGLGFAVSAQAVVEFLLDNNVR